MYLIKINDSTLRSTNDCISCMKHENVKLSLSKNLHHVIVSRQRLRYNRQIPAIRYFFFFFSTKVSLAIYHFVLDHIRVDNNQWNKTKHNRQRTIYPRHQPCPSSNARSAYYIEMMRAATRFSTFPAKLASDANDILQQSIERNFIRIHSIFLSGSLPWKIRMFESELASDDVAKV